MRMYRNFQDALNELKRDVNELGTRVHPQTMQDLFVADDPQYETREYLNQTYCVSKPRLEDLKPTQPWADEEFNERITFAGPDDGQAWRSRSEVWAGFADRGFGYTYGERFAFSLDEILSELHAHPDSRQLFLSVWNPAVDPKRFGRVRVPCSLGYWVANRRGLLHLTYLQRSADVVTHFENDVYLAHRLQRHLAENVGLDVGTFTHWIGSLHAYAKDVGGSF